MMTLAERFWSKVAIAGPNECWLWQGYQAIKGHGGFSIKGKMENSHRIAFELWWSVDVPRWLDVCHGCPEGDVKLCCNPAHLFISDAKGHMADKLAKRQMRLGSDHPSAKITEWQAIGIMARHIQGVRNVAIAREFGCSKGIVYDILRGATWAHLFIPDEEIPNVTT